MKEEKKEFWILLLIIFLGFLGLSMPYLIFPALFLNPTYSILPTNSPPSNQAIFLGITLAAYPLGQFIGSPVLGSLSDDYGRKKLLSGSLAISAFCHLIMGFAIHWKYLTVLIISRFIAGLMEGNITIARAMAADMKTIPKHKSFGKINAVASIAYLIGPLLGGVLTDKNIWKELTTSTPFYCICILFILLSILSTIILQKDSSNQRIQTGTILARINIIKRVKILFLNKRLKFFILISTAFTLAIDIFYEFSPVHLTIKWALGPSQLILYNIVLCLGLEIGNAYLPSFFSSNSYNKFTISICIGAFTIFVLGVALINSSFFILIFFGLSGLVIGLVSTLITVSISNSAPDTIQGEVLGVQISLRVLGDALICLFGSAILLISSKFILITSAAISLITMFAYSLKRDKLF